jgi:hypothetical protein
MVRIEDQSPCNRSVCRPGCGGDDRYSGCGIPSSGFYTRDRLIRVSGEGKMIKTIILSMCLAASSLSLDARAPDTHTRDALTQNDRQYTDGPVTEVDYIQVEYGHFPEYIDWLNSTWKPTMEAMKKAGIIIDYKVFQASPKSPDQPNIFLYLTFKNMAAYGGNIGDKGIEEEYVARKAIGSTEFQNKKRVERSAYRKVLGIELIREIILR